MKKYKINVMKWNLEKYNSSPIVYEKFQILLLMENASTHLVSVFKDYLLYDDMTEFFKEYYKNKEITKRLKSIFDYYESSSYLFPNYTALNEGKYIYRNIIKKQKLIDYLEDLEDKMKEKEEKKNKKKNNLQLEDDSSSYFNVFDTKVYNNIIKETGNDSKINEIFCVGNKNNNGFTDSNASLLKLVEEMKDNKKNEKDKKKDKEINKNKENKNNKENKENKETKENKDNKEIKDNKEKSKINKDKNNNNNLISNSNINLNDVNKKIKNRIESKLYISRRICINQNICKSKKLFKRPNIHLNNLLNNNLSNITTKNTNGNDVNKNQIINTDNCKSNEYIKKKINSVSSNNNKNNYKKSNIIINIMNNNKTNNYNSNLNYYTNYTNTNNTNQNDKNPNDYKNNFFKTENNKYNNNSITNKKYSINNNKIKNNSLVKDKNELKRVIIKISQNHSKKIVKKIQKNTKLSKILSFHFTTDTNYTDRMKSGTSQSNIKKNRKEVNKNKTLISPKKVKKRTKTEILGKKDIFLFGQQSDVINPYNYNKSINRQILKNINLTNTNKLHKDTSLINKKKIHYHQLGINSSRVEKKSIKHISTNSQNLTGIKILNKVSPLPLKEIIQKKTGVFSFTNTERNSRNQSKEQINKHNTMIKRNHLDSFSPQKSKEILYKKMKKIHNKNSAIICSYLTNVSSSEKIKRIKFQRNNNSNRSSSNSYYRGISSILNSKDILKRISKEKKIK